MAGASQSKAPPSFTDALGEVSMAIAQAKLSNDADLPFLNQLEMVVIGRLKHAGQQGPGGAQPAGMPGAQGGAPGGPSPEAPPGPPAGPQGAPPPEMGPPQGGPNPHAAIPPPDMEDVRRTIAETTGR
jgi:hypothetical protein